MKNIKVFSQNMKDGNIIEEGNHEELMDKNGFYIELYNSQNYSIK